MANRYWVGGAGTWDASSTTHWSASSGGSAGASVPGSADTAIFDASSGGGGVNVSGASGINSFNSSGFTGSFSGGPTISTSGGSVALGVALPALTVNSGVSNTITLNGYGIQNLTVNGTVICADALSSAVPVIGSSGTLTLKSGVTSRVETITWPGSAGAVLNSSTPGVQATLSDTVGTNTVNNIAVQDIAFDGGATWNWGTGYTDNGNNTGISVSGGSSVVPTLFGEVA